MLFSLHGVHVPHRKRTRDIKSVLMPPPSSVLLPMSMHIGRPANVSVKAGDTVYVGIKIAEADGAVSSPIYSSVSGTVGAIRDTVLSNGSKVPAVEISSDGNMTLDPSLAPPVVESREQLIDAISKSGVVGLGGAGFPTYIKFNVPSEKIEALVINGAECEPYITSDTLTMLERKDDIRTALVAFSKHLGVKKMIIGIEDNNKKAIEAMRAFASEIPELEVKVLPSIYPQGGEKVLVYSTTKKIIPEGKLPIDVGCIVINCTTVAAIGSYLSTGVPLVSRCVTVDGGAVKEPKNVTVPIGTHMSDVFDFCGGFVVEPHKVLYGGPMMGIAVPDISAPILKNTNAILALTEKELRSPKQTPCIRCGSCTNHCPLGLNPAEIARAFEAKDNELLDILHVNLCMECGCCSYICPANRPLVQNQKFAKDYMRRRAAENKAKEEKKQ